MSAINTTSPPVRWTPSRINKAMACPKPQGAIRRHENSLRPANTVKDSIIRHIALHGDLIHDGRRLSGNDCGFRDHQGAWVLVPLPDYLLTALLAFEAEMADLEPDPDPEPDRDDEPSIGANEAVSQIEPWSRSDCGVVLDALEDDECDEHSTVDDEPVGRGAP